MSYFTRRTLFATVTVFGGKVKEANIQQTIESPHIVIRDEGNAIRKYCLGLGEGKFKETYLQVLERDHGNDTQRVRTAWFTREIENGEIL